MNQELIELLEAYLAHPSSDGSKDREILRAKLAVSIGREYDFNGYCIVPKEKPCQ